jgi:hypothetical protein
MSDAPHTLRPLNILYVAKHEAGGNEDERAVSTALRLLGHKVYTLHEWEGHRVQSVVKSLGDQGITLDFMLFHKWGGDVALFTLDALEGVVPRVFWYWDLVDWPGDSSLRRRNRERIAWMMRTVPRVDAGFLSDGDWLNTIREKGHPLNQHSDNLCMLRQGANLLPSSHGGNNVMEAPATPSQGDMLTSSATSHSPPSSPISITTIGGAIHGVSSILMTGIRAGGGRGRVNFVDEMSHTYGSKFKHISSGTYGGALGREIRSHPIVVAPDSPCTDAYWSNRVYVTLGHRGFLLHPYCKELAKEYEDRQDLVYYHSRSHLHALIAEYLPNDEATSSIREGISTNGYLRTVREHTYLHRCERMIDELGRMGLVPRG